MAVEALCPTCGAVFNLKDEFQGKKVRCKKCEHVFTVGGEPQAKERDEDRGVKAAPGAGTRKRARDDDEDERTTSRKSRVAGKRGREDDEEDDEDEGRSRKRKRVYHDDDEDEDRPVRRKSGGGSGMMIAIVCGVIVLVLAVIAGGIYGVYCLLDKGSEVVDEVEANAGNPGQNNAGPNNNPFFPGGGPNPDFPGFDRQPANMDDALASLKADKPANHRRGAANWLARQPVDAGRQNEVARALEPLVSDADEGTCVAGGRALAVWGTRANGPALTAALKQKPEGGIPGDPQKALMAALGRVKYEPGADEILRFLPNAFVGDDAERALADMGPGAEKAVIKYYHHPEDHVRQRARRVIAKYRTTAAAILDQTAEDLASGDKGRTGPALEWLSKGDSNAALQATRADAARRKAVAVALNRVIEDPPSPFVTDQIISAAKRWGTKDNVAALVAMLVKDPFKKRECGDALIAIGPACQVEVMPLLEHKDEGVRNEAKRVLKAVGGGGEDLDIIEAIADLKTGEYRRLERAGPVLEKARVSEKKRADVVAAALGALQNGFNLTDQVEEGVAKGLAAWATKDDAPAIIDKVRELDKFHRRKTRQALMTWLGKQKIEKAIPVLVVALGENDDRPVASKALQALGPDLGASIQVEVLKLQPGLNKPLLIEIVKILGAVGNKDVVSVLERQKTLSTKQKDLEVVQVCDEAITAIKGR